MSVTGPRRPGSHYANYGGLLTAREQELMKYLHLGMTNREIAAAMTIEVKSVEKHIQNIMFKVGLGRRVLLALWWDHATEPYRHS